MNDGLHVIIKFAEKLNQYFQDFKTSSHFPNPNDAYAIQEALEDYRVQIPAQSEAEKKLTQVNKACGLIESLFYLDNKWITHPAYTGDTFMGFIQNIESKDVGSDEDLPYISWEHKTRCGKRVCMGNTSPDPALCQMLKSFYDEIAQAKTDDIQATSWITDTQLNKVSISPGITFTI